MRITILAALILFLAQSLLSQTSLHKAVLNNDLAAARQLLDGGMNVDTTGPDGRSALLLASGVGNIPMMELLLTHNANPELGDTSDYQPLHAAAEMGNFDAVKLLVANGAYHDAECRQWITPTLSVPKTPYNLTKSQEIHDYFRNMIDNYEFPKTGRVFIMLTKYYGLDGHYRKAIGAGFPVDERDHFGRSALMYAAMDNTNARRLMELLIDEKVNCAAKDKWGRTALHYLANTCQYEDLEDILGKKLFDIEAKDDDGRTPLLMCSFKCGSNTVKALLDAGANPNAADNDGNNALFACVRHGDDEHALESVNALLKHKANPNLQDNDGYTPLISALYRNKYECAKALIDAGADVNLQTTNNFTAAMQAMYCNNAGTAEKMLELILSKKPSNLNAKSDGKSALMLAQEKGYDSCVSMLKEAGAAE